MTVDPGQADPVLISNQPEPPRPQSGVRNVFVGPNGIRAGWRLLIFLAIFIGLLSSAGFLLSRIPAVRAFQQAQPKGMLTAAGQISSEGLTVLVLIISAFIMTKIERRSFADYSLPPGEAFGKRFWQGVPLGLAMLSLLMALIGLFHGFSLGGFAITGTEAIKYGVLYGIGFILVGIFEEFSFRGYMQSTLASGIGFWPAAIVLSILFGAIHLQNSGEAIYGAAMAGGFGLVAAFSLLRTGNLWFAIGMHASWDWGETYMYSVPDSGLIAQGHLLNSSFHGPPWLTGGSVGPEGSAFVFLVLLIWAAAIHFLFPSKQLRS
ncbi:MAG: CPBP family intramembrane glutamic endopeptidase [Candidatus Acidiferrales bacterium]|jgi:membrane protease YdiL (CAAX protease family)